jgi:hypothetical protein
MPSAGPVDAVAGELAERIALLNEEIGRLEAAMKEVGERNAAQSVFENETFRRPLTGCWALLALTVRVQSSGFRVDSSPDASC